MSIDEVHITPDAINKPYIEAREQGVFRVERKFNLRPRVSHWQSKQTITSAYQEHTGIQNYGNVDSTASEETRTRIPHMRLSCQCNAGIIPRSGFDLLPSVLQFSTKGKLDTKIRLRGSESLGQDNKWISSGFTEGLSREVKGT